MKPLVFVLFAVFACLVGCGPTGLDESGLPQPRPELAAKAGISLDEMGEGYWVFSRKCMECHEARLPKGQIEGVWHPVVDGMSGNAGLSTSENAAVVNYVRAANLR
ncbi:hypothetical protein [Roseibacillus persicicus]|uniref:Cytochrome c domain-containing protein n=1 Tax=Roseibacillus persicicus TaxID=454148 RepID=A0A918WPV9_9BACT|nr:hypothetical protein [Roseibacillus persicicus]GHC66543.1 hypothetical protein GCM10007100_38070 [Roseibacillus persicicus]